MNQDLKSYLKNIFWERNYKNILNFKEHVSFKNILPIISVMIQSLIFIFVVGYSFKKIYKNGDFADKFLITGAFFSSVSWFFLANKYAFVHLHLCFIAWYISFIPYAYALLIQKLPK